MGFLVVATDPIESDCSIELEELAAIDAEFRIAQCSTEEDVAHACGDADGILVTSQLCSVGRRALAEMPRCRIIVRTGIGYDVIDVAAATERKVMVANVPDYCTSEVADHTLAMILCLWRKVVEFDAQVRAEGWSGMLRPLHRLDGRVIGIIGLGRIGQAVGVRARAFGLRRIAYDPYVPADVFSALGIESVSLDVLARSADIITLHTPLTHETRGLIREEILRQMKPTAILVNTSRGGLVVTDHLVQALREGWISGAGLDVLETEPLPHAHPLRSLPRVLLTPHAAWYSVESVRELRRRSVRIVVQALRGEVPASLVNPEVIARLSS